MPMLTWKSQSFGRTALFRAISAFRRRAALQGLRNVGEHREHVVGLGLDDAAAVLADDGRHQQVQPADHRQEVHDPVAHGQPGEAAHVQHEHRVAFLEVGADLAIDRLQVFGVFVAAIQQARERAGGPGGGHPPIFAETRSGRRAARLRPVSRRRSDWLCWSARRRISTASGGGGVDDHRPAEQAGGRAMLAKIAVSPSVLGPPASLPVERLLTRDSAERGQRRWEPLPRRRPGPGHQHEPATDGPNAPRPCSGSCPPRAGTPAVVSGCRYFPWLKRDRPLDVPSLTLIRSSTREELLLVFGGGRGRQRTSAWAISSNNPATLSMRPAIASAEAGAGAGGSRIRRAGRIARS